MLSNHEAWAAARGLACGLLAAGLLACGGGGSGGDAGDNPGDGDGGGGGTPPASRVYIGYYAEDAANNPEDPTVGVLMFRVPQADGPFAGQMPFSYVGCSAGVDTGRIEGTRSGAALSGNWSGVMDGSVPVGGSLSATLDAAQDRYSGSFTNAAGKVAVANGPCRYFIAATGSFEVWGEAARVPASFTVTAGTTTTPTFNWSALPAGTFYTLRLFDDACLQDDPGDPQCFVGESMPLTALSARYPGDFLGGRTALTAGRAHLAVLTAQNPVTGAFAGFTSTRFTP